MLLPPLSPLQLDIIERRSKTKIFLEGLAGVGKTTVGVERMLYLMKAGISGNSILVLVPQRTLGTPFIEAIQTPGVVAGGMVTILTISGLAQRMVDLFWPIISEQAGFSNPDYPPIFLTLETAQYYMARLVRPLLEEGHFDSVTIDRNRLFSQILDNLNKAAVVGFSHTEIGDRLKSAWSGEPGQTRVYDDAQLCATTFREYCLKHNLLDFSLQVEVFWHYLWNLPVFRDYLTSSYRHLIVDNIEEDVPVTHSILADWLPLLDSALLIYDSNAGYRRFLGADPIGAYKLRELCEDKVVFEKSYVASPEIQSLAAHLSRILTNSREPLPEVDPRPALFHDTRRYFPEMLDWITDEIKHLIFDEGLSPGEIVVMAPFLSDALRFSLMTRLQNQNIPVKSHRPSRSLREEPATYCLLTLASIAHPEWGFKPSKYDVVYSLMQAIDGIDLIRAQLLTEIVYRLRDGVPTLTAFDQIISTTQERISYVLGERYEHLRLWLEENRQSPKGDLDHFLSMLFGEVLSQPGYGFHTNYDTGVVTANLVESIRKFRRVAAQGLTEAGIPLGKEYIEMVRDGVIAAQYISSWQSQKEDAVLVAPAYTFLIGNYPVEVQFWLDVGNRSWAERLYQPLTHPYVLSRNWSENKLWTDVEEVETSQAALSALVLGLVHRCRRRIYLGLSELNEQGYEQRGPLLHAFHRILQSLAEN
jgi:UvrD/REP helicase N-terminal domain